MISVIRPRPNSLPKDSIVFGKSWVHIAPDIWLFILDCLDLTDIFNLAAVNRKWRAITMEIVQKTGRCVMTKQIPDSSRHSLFATWIAMSPHLYQRETDLLFNSGKPHPLITSGVIPVERESCYNDKTLYAGKYINVPEHWKLDLKTAKQKVFEESKALRSARHHHVVKVIETLFFDQEFGSVFAIIMERADTNLDFYLRSSKRAQENDLAPWFGCLISAVAYIHRSGNMHRGIKPTNILVKNNRVLLADFGISRASLQNTIPHVVPPETLGRVGRVGIREYCASDVGTSSADIFSLGAVFLEMLLAIHCPSKRMDLDRVLNIEGGRSYARYINRVHYSMLGILEQHMQAWGVKVLSHVQKMLSEDPDQRPLASSLDSTWSAFDSSDAPLASCKCLELALRSTDLVVPKTSRTL